MDIEDTFIDGLRLIHLKKVIDERGRFLKFFNSEFFKKNGLETDFKESYYSISHKYVIRGMHFQIPPYEHTKLVCLAHGRILDAVLDLRKESLTFKKYYAIELNVENPTLLYIPFGCAHGFLSLEENTIITYFQSSVYEPLCDYGIKYDSFGMNWGIDNPIVSERDKTFLDLNRFITPF